MGEIIGWAFVVVLALCAFDVLILAWLLLVARPRQVR